MFLNLTLEQVGGLLSRSNFWSVEVPRAAESYPVIFHSSLALAALDHLQRTANSESDSGQGYYAFSLQECNTAIHELVQLTKKDTFAYSDKEAILLATVFLIGIACIQGNLNQALMHVRKALQLIDHWHFWLEADTPVRSRGSRGVLDSRWLLHLISYFEFQAHEIDATIVANSWKCHARQQTQQKALGPFACAADAYYEYMPIHFGFTSDPSFSRRLPQACDDQNDAPSFENVYRSWRLRFQKLAEDSGAADDEERLAISTLQALVNCERICRHVLGNNTKDVWRTSNVIFQGIVDVAGRLLGDECGHGSDRHPNRIMPTFTFSLSAVEILRLVGFVSRNGNIRRHVVTLLHKYQRRNGLWDSKLSSTLIEAKMALEEGSMVRFADGGECGCELNVFACKEHRSRTLKSEMVGDKMFRTSINSWAGQLRGEPDTHVSVEWD
ncbi:hypothetical protein V2A60_001517 [Cordyceps javanica]